MSCLDSLNPQQREAAAATDGPVLVLAGAGTGKTRVITHRIAHLMEQGTPGHLILAVTFTNKAAREMKDRVAALLARTGQGAGDPWISTFHSFCARLLRQEAPALGLRRDFAIYDDGDQAAAVKLALRQLGYEERNHQPRALLERISFAKNHGRTPEQLAAEACDPPSRAAAKVFEVYEEILRKNGALDFDDLLLRAVEALRRIPETRARWSARFRYVQVDEYQDTNRIQYELLRLLTGERPNLCVVGDEDQSIYSWRGADINNILRFAEDFPGARVFRLEQNYRSTQNILDAAGAVVAKNVRRLGKSLVAVQPAGPNLQFFEARDAKAEAEFVAGQIFHQQRGDTAACGEENRTAHFAVLYRTTFQSRAFEEEFRRLGIRYRVIGSRSFYQRAEIKDALSYVRLAINPDDDVALLRVLNTPARGIGQTTVEKLQAIAQQRGGSLWSAIQAAIEASASGLAPLRGFRELLENLRAEQATLGPARFLEVVLDRTGYLEMLAQRDTADNLARVENLRELVNAVAEGAEQGETLADFLDRAALVSNADNYDERAAVSLLTLHSAKGLEFDHVFLTGLEEGLFPHSRSVTDEASLEEERRLCYVGMTRARKMLTLTRAVYRRVFGGERLDASVPSRFLLEIPGELMDTVPGSLAEAGESRRYEPDPEYSFTSAEFSRRARYTAASRSKSSASPRPVARSRRSQANPLIGTTVRHPTYGLGTIIAVEGEEDDRKLTVSFGGRGTKKLVERYAQLEPA